MEASFGSPWQVIRSASTAFRPPERVSVAEGAAKNLMIVQPGGYTGPWSAEETPYMVEPMNILASRKHEAVCFVGPARSGKTLGLLDAWFAYAVTCDPGDMLVIQMTQDKARDYSKMRISRAIRHSPALKAMINARGHDDNTHDKLFKHGMWIKIGWPSASQLASTDYRYVALTDYDRMPDDVDGEGSAFQLGLKRTTTFLSRGMCMVESSPGREMVDPLWRPATPHEGPPCGGIIGIYNRGDRRRFYWPCPHCGEFYEAAPGLTLFISLPSEEELLGIVREADLSKLARKHAVIFCPHCGAGTTAEHKQSMLERGQWLRDGQSIDCHGNKSGEGIESSIASYWLGGVAAAYQKWESLILRYLQGLRDYAASGDEHTLRTTVNTDQALPYLPLALREEARRGNVADLAEDFPRFIVPTEALFLTAAIDVQKNHFVVQVHAHGPYLEQWLIDRYDIRESLRPGSVINPATYPEDWDALTEKVVKATYRTHIEGQELRIKLTIVDSGGAEGVTEHAYSWYRKIRKAGLSDRVKLYKGGNTHSAPILKLTKVGGKLKDIPLLLCNPNLLKDAVSNAARRIGGGQASLHFPRWLSAAFWDEFKAEIREPNGKWKKIRERNEALDLSCMNRAAAIALGADRMNWNNAPSWARPLEQNSERITREERRAMKVKPVASKAQRYGSDEWRGRL